MSLIPDPDVRLGAFASTDVLAGTIVVPLENDDGDVVDLDGYVAQSGSAIAPDGTETTLTAEVVEIVDGTSALEFTFADLAVDVPGVWRLVAVLTDPAGSQLETESLRFVTENRDSGWLSLAESRQLWRDAPRSDVALWRLLEVARTAVETYGRIGSAPLPDPIPDPWRDAQRAYAREVWSATKRDPGTLEIGDPAFSIQVPTLSPAIKDMIRPKSVKPVVA